MRKLASVLALAIAALSVADYLGWRADHRRLLELAASSGIDRYQPEIAVELAREPVAARAAVQLAWTLLDLEVDRAWLGELPPAERRAETERGLQRLESAQRLAEEVLRRQPASWRAATVIGASRYLEASRRRQQDQPTSAWRDPLRAAMSLAPAYPEPPTLLASAYLSRWSSLSADERQEVPALLSRALEDERGLQILLPAWVRRAPSLERLLEPIPDRPDAWQRLGREFLRLGDLERFGVAHGRRLASLPPWLADRVEKGRARLRGGHRRAGAGMLLSVFQAPPDLDYGDSVAASLAALPEEALGRDARRDLEAWRLWTEDLCAVGRCPFDPATRAQLARAAGSDPAAAPAGAEVAADDWQRRGAAYRRQVQAAAPAAGLRLEMPGVPADGAAVELRWDGRFAGVIVVAPGEPLVGRLAIEEGLHLLEVSHLTGRPLRPGNVTLAPG